MRWVFRITAGNTIQVDPGGARPVVKYGYGNELCFQSLNDTVLTAAVADSGVSLVMTHARRRWVLHLRVHSFGLV